MAFVKNGKAGNGQKSKSPDGNGASPNGNGRGTEAENSGNGAQKQARGSSGVNRATIVGNLGQDPEVKFLGDGRAVCNFSVATSQRWTDKEGVAQERTEWHRVVVWGKTAEACGEFLSKGRQVYVEGSLQTRMWVDDADVKHYVTEIVASNVLFLGQGKGKSDEGRGQAPQGRPTQQQQGADDIPF